MELFTDYAQLAVSAFCFSGLALWLVFIRIWPDMGAENE